MEWQILYSILFKKTRIKKKTQSQKHKDPILAKVFLNKY